MPTPRKDPESPLGVWLEGNVRRLPGATKSAIAKGARISRSRLYELLSWPEDRAEPPQPTDDELDRIEGEVIRLGGIPYRPRAARPDPQFERVNRQLEVFTKAVSAALGNSRVREALGAKEALELQQQVCDLRAEAGNLALHVRSRDDIWEFGPDVPWRVGLDQRFSDHGRQSEALLGVPREDLIGKHFTALLTGESARRAGRVFRSAWDEGVKTGDWSRDVGHIAVEARRQGTSETVWLDVAARWVRNEAGQPVGAVGISRDITRWVEVQRLVHDSLDDPTVAVAIVDHDGRFRLADPTLCDFLEATPEDLVSKKFTDVTHPDDYDASVRSWKELRDDPKLGGYVIRKRYVSLRGDHVFRAETTVRALTEYVLPQTTMFAVCCIRRMEAAVGG